jgi:pimeloyl-ACP methyl ester carboxylesterase
VGGVSMGGYAAMALLREDAGRVRGLILIDTQPGADDEAGKQAREETAKAVEAHGSGVLVERMLPKLISAGAAAAVRYEVERMIRDNPREGAAAASRGMGLRTDSKDVLARYAGPALVAVGDKDAITPPEKAKAMAELIKGSQLAVIPGAGHLSNLEAPSEFNQIAEAFLRAIPAG